MLAHALAFVAGFSLIFIALGLSASAIGGVLDANRVLIAQIGGVLVVLLGLHDDGNAAHPPLLMRDTRPISTSTGAPCGPRGWSAWPLRRAGRPASAPF